MSNVRALPTLIGDQRQASDPTSHVWLSASAGTGKTQVLAARVFRLLLRGVDPGAILCLTFTKAGAAEMAERVSSRLAAWVRMDPDDLGRDLNALGETKTPELIGRARTLFARVLDAPGGGLRIQTIHGFCQGLLAAFPVEAGFAPGFRPIEAREEAVLARETLAQLLVDAEAQGRMRPTESVGALSLRLGEGEAERFLLACARAPAGMERLPTGVAPFVRRALDLPAGDVVEALERGCDAFDDSAVERLIAADRAWGTATGTKQADAAQAWLSGSPAERVASLLSLLAVVRTGKGDPRAVKPKQLAAEPDYVELAAEIGDACAELIGLAARAAYADLLSDGLEVGREYAAAYTRAKSRAGTVDFDDLIRATVALLQQPGIGEWIRYKLDQSTDHVLIDEAQDTNIAQWIIVRALVDEFFSGDGARTGTLRTLFTVGDYKQAIFGFQGTSPVFFQAAENHFAEAARAAGDAEWEPERQPAPFAQLSLTASFRSTTPILEFVDAALEMLPEPGLGAPVEIHASEVPGPGTVTLWTPTMAGEDEGEEEWASDAIRAHATRIARQIRDWTNPANPLILRSGKPLRPEDVMILVRRRGELAALVVARLYMEGVPVAGVDRLRLNAPLAVQDLLAAVRFALQPDDDLSLASLLVSPLIGWSQEDLLAAAPRERGRLWRHLRGQGGERLAPLYDILARADLATPYRFLEQMLSGPLDGRRKLVRRLGAEARDPIEELLNAALQFETLTTPSLQLFLDWFDRGDVEVKRDPSQPMDAVRVMTAHGAKGLQAPLVILADATTDPGTAPRSFLKWTPDELGEAIPIFRPRATERGGPLGEIVAAAAQADLEEHWRLFYVAATRAEEHLVIAGALGNRSGGRIPTTSWYGAASRAMAALGIEDEGDLHFTGIAPTEAVGRMEDEGRFIAVPVALPAWASQPAPIEARPPRPLAPSSLGEDMVADPPPGPAMRAAAERGRLLHALFERLPPVAPSERAGAADRWLAGSGGVDDPAERAEIASAALRVIQDPRFAELFGQDALAEAPIAAVVASGLVVSGTVDRLCVGAECIQIVDFKTGRRAPKSVDELPVYHLRQMAAYVAALRIIFPGRPVEAALLYTAAPILFALPQELLDRHKPDFAAEEQSLIVGG